MPIRPRLITSTQRRSRKADSLTRRVSFAIRSCSAYISRGLTYSVTPESKHCIECYRSYYRYELALLIAEVDRLGKKEKKLRSERLTLKAKVLRLRKQERMLRKKMRELRNREEQNILDLKIDKSLAAALNSELSYFVPAPGIPFSPAGFFQVSFSSLDRTSLILISSS
jgi:hypothetical protein